MSTHGYPDPGTTDLPPDTMRVVAALMDALEDDKLAAALAALGPTERLTGVESRAVLRALVAVGPWGADHLCRWCGWDARWDGSLHAAGCAWEAARRLLEGGDDGE